HHPGGHSAVLAGLRVDQPGGRHDLYVLRSEDPLLSIEVLPAEIAEDAPAARRPRRLGIVVRNPSVIIAAAIVAFLALFGALAPMLGTISPSEITPVYRNKKPGAERTIRT